MNRKIPLLFLLLLCLGIFAGLVYWGIGPSIACLFSSEDAPGPGRSAQTITTNDGQRCFLLYIPKDFDPERPIDLIFSLHGFSSNPHGQRTFSQWDLVAEEVYAVVVYPQGTGFPQRWNADPAFFIEGADDVGFVQILIHHLSNQLPINPDHIFLTGFSNGGAMTLRLACELSSQIAAIGTVAAPVSPSLIKCQPERAMPLIAFHGTQDPIVPFTGRDYDDWETLPIGGVHMPTPILLPALTWGEQWADKNGCNTKTRDITDTDDIKVSRFLDCPEGSEVIYYSIMGGGHTWPGGRPIPFVGKTSKEVNASRQMWAFFTQHPLH